MYVKTFFSHRRSKTSSQIKWSGTTKSMDEIADFITAKILSLIQFGFNKLFFTLQDENLATAFGLKHEICLRMLKSRVTEATWEPSHSHTSLYNQWTEIRNIIMSLSRFIQHADFPVTVTISLYLNATENHEISSRFQRKLLYL